MFQGYLCAFRSNHAYGYTRGNKIFEILQKAMNVIAAKPIEFLPSRVPVHAAARAREAHHDVKGRRVIRGLVTRLTSFIHAPFWID